MLQVVKQPSVGQLNGSVQQVREEKLCFTLRGGANSSHAG